MKNTELGAFINIEGSDGSGKATQTQLLATRARSEQLLVETFEYPNYKSIASTMVQLYLGGKLPQRMQRPEAASLYYAIDRNANADAIIHARKLGHLVITDRYTPSNLAHQGTKIPNREDRRTFYEWAMDLEFNRLELPKPTKNIVLIVEPEASFNNVSRRTDSARENGLVHRESVDIHENAEHLTRSVEVYQELCDLYPDWFVPIDCMEGSNMRSKDEIAADVWGAVKEVL